MSQEMGTNGPKSPGKSGPTSPIASPESDEVDFEELQAPLPATTISVTAKVCRVHLCWDCLIDDGNK